MFSLTCFADAGIHKGVDPDPELRLVRAPSHLAVGAKVQKRKLLWIVSNVIVHFVLRTGSECYYWDFFQVFSNVWQESRIAFLRSTLAPNGV